MLLLLLLLFCFVFVLFSFFRLLRRVAGRRGASDVGGGSAGWRGAALSIAPVKRPQEAGKEPLRKPLLRLLRRRGRRRRRRR